MKVLQRYGADLLIAAGFLILPFLLYGAVTLGGKTMLPVDNLFQWAPWQSYAAEFGAAIPHNNLLTDLIIENYAWKRFAVSSISNGEIPLWNPYLFGGAPFLANGQHGMLYPFSWIHFLLPEAKAYGWYTISQIWLAGAAMYIFGRVLNMRRGSAAIAGLIYQGSGFLLSSAAVFPMIIGAAAWLPFLLAMLEKVITSAVTRSRQTVIWMALGAVALGLQILAGHIEITYYTLLIMAVYALWRLMSVTFKVRRGEIVRDLSPDPWYRIALRPVPWLIGLVAVGLMLGSLQLVPFYEVGQMNFREGAASFAEVRGWAFPWRRLITLLLPNFFGNPAHHDYLDLFTRQRVAFSTNSYGELNPQGAYSSDWGLKNYVEGGIYLAILPLVLAVLGAVEGWRSRQSPRRLQALLFALLAFFSLAFIFGTPLYGVLYYGLPFINQLHTPFRWVWPLSLSVAVLAGFGVDYLLRYGIEEPRKRIFDFLHVLIAASAVCGAAIVAVLLFSWLFYDSIEPFIDRIFHGLALADTAFRSAREFYSYEFWQVFVLGLSLLASGLVLWLAARGRKQLFLLLATLLIILDIFLANHNFSAAADPRLLAFKPQLASWLQEQPGQWRLTSFTPHGDKPFNANSAWLYDLQDIRGYDSIITRQYIDYMEAIEAQSELPYNRVGPISNWESLNSPLLDVLGVRYIISSETIDLPKLSQVWQGEGVRVYENLAVAPRAYILPQTTTAVVDDALQAMTNLDPRFHVVIETADAPPGLVVDQVPAATALEPAQIVAYRNIEVVVDATVEQPSWLILNDSYFPGWKAFVRPLGAGEEEESEVPVTRVNGNFRGVALEPGAWTVRFRYSPATFQLGGLLSAMGMIILMFFAGIWTWRLVYRPSGELSTTHSVLKNSALPMGLNLFNRLIDFVFAMYYLRILGPADSGRYVAAVTTAGFFEILANYGLDILLIRDVSQDKSRANHYLFNTTIFRLGAALVASIPVFIFMWGTRLTENPLTIEEVAAVLLIMVGMVFSGMSKGVTGLFYVYEEAEIPAAMTTATTILKVGLGVIVLLLGYSFVGLAGVSIVVNIITLAVLLFLAVRRFGLHGPWQFDAGLQRELVRMGFPLMLIHLLQTIFISIDILLLRLMLRDGEEVVGYYQTAYKWFNALQIIPAFFTLALFPVITREINRSMESARRMYTLSLKLMLLLALPIAAYTMFLAPSLVRLLGGPQYLPQGAIALQIVIWSIPFGWLNSVTNYVLIALGLEGLQPRAFAVAVGFNIVANVIFIPRYSYVAASVTTILSEIVLMVVFAYFLRRRMEGVDWLELMWRPWLVTLVMVAAMLAASQVHLLLALLLGLVLYPAGLLALRVIGDEEKQVLADILPGSLSARLGLIRD
ncbi:MAG: oligosaccharide flippase family protein [Candidatus Promineifilaceae bacterium]